MASKAKSEGKGAPKLNKYMHPRNPYSTPPSFKLLAQRYPAFRTHCTYDLAGKVQLDFKNPLALRSLTTCLLHHDFQLKVDIPEGRLVPTLPLRLNYLLWLEDLMTLARHTDTRQTRLGVDVGTGSACIYPLLAAKKFGWRMVCTEADEVNYQSAVKNVTENELTNKINVIKVDEKCILRDVLAAESTQSWARALSQNNEDKSGTDAHLPAPPSSGDAGNSTYLYDFTMCNPPFFSCEEDTYTMTKTKRDRGEPISAPTGSVQEMVTPGGEVAFITQMVQESVQLKHLVRVFSTLIGTKADVREVKQVLAGVCPAHSTVTEFCQGRTMRWGVAWTFDPSLRLGQVLSKKQRVTARPLVLVFPRSLMTAYSVAAAWKMVARWLHALKVKVQVFKNTKYFIGARIKAYKPTWLHQRRRKREIDRKRTAKCDGTEGAAAGGDQDTADVEMQGADLKNEMDHDEKSPLKRTVETAIEEPINKKLKLCDVSCQEQKDLANEQDHGEQNEVQTHEHHEGTSGAYTANSPDDSGIGNSPGKDGSDIIEIKTQQKEGKAKGGGQRGPECILRFSVHIHQKGGLVSMEVTYLDGSAGKDGLNQVVQFMRNQLTNPSL